MTSINHNNNSNMKTKNIKLATGSFQYPELEEKINVRDTAIKEMARKCARHYAKRNQPALKGDSLYPYTGEIRAGYEEVITYMLQYLQPEAGYPESRMEEDFFNEKEKELGEAIKEREEQNLNDSRDLEEYKDHNILVRKNAALALSAFILVGEIIYNTGAFQVTGDNMLTALVISVSISVGVIVFSNLIPSVYRRAKSSFEKKNIIGATGAVSVLVFGALSLMRVSYLARHGINVSPFWFGIINIFLFIVSLLIGFFLMPTKKEIEEDTKRHKLDHEIRKRKNEIKEFLCEIESIKETKLERNKMRSRNTHLAMYLSDRICKMYKESMEIFKSNNISNRPDRKVPDCFNYNEQSLELDIKARATVHSIQE